MPFQNATNVNTTADLLVRPTELAVLVDSNNIAEGEVVFDDGLTTNNTLYSHYRLKFTYTPRPLF